MKTKIKGLALTAMLLSGTSMTYAEQGASSVGDLPGFGEEAYFHEDATYADNAELAPTSHVGDSPMDAPFNPQFAAAAYEKVSAAQMQTASFSQYAGPGCDVDCGCETVCDGSCDAACGKKSKLLSIFDNCKCKCNGWATTEALIWFAPDREMPALITQSNPGTFPILPQGGPDNVSTVFGDDISGEVSGGFRLDYGTYVTKNVGIGARLWWMADNNDSYAASGDGSQYSIGRPFYNTAVPGNDALLVALDGTFTGSIAAQSELSVWGGEAYSRIKLRCNKGYRLDLIGGYTHFEIEDKLGITSGTITNATARFRQYRDLFKTDNRFDGGQVGFEMVMTHGRWSARSLTKVHLGNMRQRVNILGGSSDQTPPAPANVTSGGLLAMGNQGEFSRDKFAFAPELNFKLGYCLRDNVSLSVGYSLIYWDNVALVGDVVDFDVDGTALNTGNFGNRPVFDFDDSSLWVQGVDFGIVIDI